MLSVNECCYPFSLHKILSFQHACWTPYNVCLSFIFADIDSNLVQRIKKKNRKARSFTGQESTLELEWQTMQMLQCFSTKFHPSIVNRYSKQSWWFVFWCFLLTDKQRRSFAALSTLWLLNADPDHKATPGDALGGGGGTQIPFRVVPLGIEYSSPWLIKQGF